MSRPLKKGINYFPLDTDFMTDRKMQRLLLKHGSNGIITYLAFLTEIYSGNGYYICHSNDLFLNIGFGMNIPEAEIKEIIDSCVNIGIFDKKQLKTNKIYTSSGIQQRYFEIVKRNKSTLNPNFLTDGFIENSADRKIVSVKGSTIIAAKTRISATKTPVTVEKTTINVYED